MKFFILLLFIIFSTLIILTMINAITFKKHNKNKRTPKLSKLHGEKFKEYMDNLRKDL